MYDEMSMFGAIALVVIGFVLIGFYLVQVDQVIAPDCKQQGKTSG